MSFIDPLIRQSTEPLAVGSKMTASRMAAFKASLRRFAALIRSQKGHLHPPYGHDSDLFNQWQQLVRLGRPSLPNEQRLLDAMITLHSNTSTKESLPSGSPVSFGFHSPSPVGVSSGSSVWMGSPEIHTFQSDRMVDYTSWDEMDYEGDDIATTHRLIRGFYRFTRHHLPPKDPIEIAIFLVMEYHFIFDLSIKMVEITRKMKQIGPVVFEWDRERVIHDMGDSFLQPVLDTIVSKVSVLHSLPIDDAMLTNEVFFQRMTPTSVCEFIHEMMDSLSHVKQFLGSVKKWLHDMKSQVGN